MIEIAILLSMDFLLLLIFGVLSNIYQLQKRRETREINHDIETAKAKAEIREAMAASKVKAMKEHMQATRKLN
jgi:hypothetical protein